MPEIIDTVIAKTSPKRSFSMTEYERFGLVFAKTVSINSGTDEVGRYSRGMRVGGRTEAENLTLMHL
jgi:hypothetical protein